MHRRVRKSEVIHGPEAPAARPPRRPPRLLRGRGPGHAGGGRGAAPLRRPVYVRHEIVHNRTVVERLKARGAVFVEELDEVPVAAQVVFSAHGVPKSVRAELVVVIGSPNSHNSQRLREVAERASAGRATLLPRADSLDWSALDGVRTLGLTAGASAPETLVQELLGRLAERYTLSVEERRVTEENVVFRLAAPLN